MRKVNVPDHLSDVSRELFNHICLIWKFEALPDIQLLTYLCETVDRVADARAEIAENGPYIEDRFKQRRENPALKSERDNKLLYSKLLKKLRLGEEIKFPDPKKPRHYKGRHNNDD